jgi:hypothetical protein
MSRKWLTKEELEFYYKKIKEQTNMSENYIMLNGKRVDLTDEQIEKLGLKLEKDCFERVKPNVELYYYIGTNGEVLKDYDTEHIVDEKRYAIANYCTNKELMEQRALHETLSRLLWRFSIQHDGCKIDYTSSSARYYIYYNYEEGTFKISDCNYTKSHQLFYASYSIAHKAIDEIILPFMKEHPEFVW